MRNVELTITGFTNQNNFYESHNESKIDDYSEYCEHIEEDKEKNVYNVQYTLTD